MEKEITRIDKNGEDIIKHISYISQLLEHSSTLMASPSSNLFNNISEGIYRINCKYKDDVMQNM